MKQHWETITRVLWLPDLHPLLGFLHKTLPQLEFSRESRVCSKGSHVDCLFLDKIPGNRIKVWKRGREERESQTRVYCVAGHPCGQLGFVPTGTHWGIIQNELQEIVHLRMGKWEHLLTGSCLH